MIRVELVDFTAIRFGGDVVLLMSMKAARLLPKWLNKEQRVNKHRLLIRNIYSIPTYLGNNDEVFYAYPRRADSLLMFMQAASFWLLPEALKKSELTNTDSSNRNKSIILTESNTNQIFLGRNNRWLEAERAEDARHWCSRWTSCRAPQLSVHTIFSSK